jgi:hypothetical protein
MQCDATAPEQTVLRYEEQPLEVVDDATGELVTVTTTVVVEEIVPSHPCQAEATALARSMEEVDGAWVTTEDALYCAEHFQAGTMTHADGSVTEHAVMAVAP